MRSRRRKLQAEGEEDADHTEPEGDKPSEKEPSEFEMKNMSPNTEGEGKGSLPSPKTGEGLVTPNAKPERHDLTMSHIKRTRSETSENSLGRMMDMTMNTGQRRDRTENPRRISRKTTAGEMKIGTTGYKQTWRKRHTQSRSSKSYSRCCAR